MPIKTYRGLIEDGAQERVRLSTVNGMTGYRIKKIELFPHKPGQESVESTVCVWKTEQETVSTTAIEVDFGDSRLLAAACFHDSSSESNLNPLLVTFDREVFNQDIYITHTDTNSSIPINYYIELEAIGLNQNSQSVVTLKDIRTNTA